MNSKLDLQDESLILSGVILRPHGLQGSVVIRSFTQDPKMIFDLNLVDINHNVISIVFKHPVKNNNFVCTISGCDTIDRAILMKQTKLYCYRKNIPALEQDRFYIFDLIDLDVLNIQKQTIGKVKNILNYGAGDLIEIKFHDKRITELFIFSEANFPQINKGYIIFNGTRV